MTFEMTSIEKTSPNFSDCESYIDLGFSGLEAYWKPQAMLNLLEFINENQAQPRRTNTSKKTKLDKDLDKFQQSQREALVADG